MASVWAARQRGKHGFEKLVAIKTILPKFAADLRFQEMFLDEARIASRIEHPNVAQILDLGEEHEILYLVMEYVEGDALSKLNRACQKAGVKIPPGIILRVLADVCAGLHDAHELVDPDGHALEIVHRDVSPHNILVSNKGIAKLIDFGIAKARSRAGTDTNSGVLKGKIQYMAPEQASGAPIDRRADIWAVGAILYHLIAGKPPYEGDNQLATLHLLGSGRPPVPLASTVHPSIAAVARTALTHDPERRFATAADMRDALERAMFDSRANATQSEVAQFWAQHMSDRSARRRQAIENSISMMADRRRVDEMLRPPGARRSSSPSIPPPASASMRTPASIPPPARSVDPRASSSDFPAATPGPVAIPTSDAVAKLTARLSEPPPSPVGSYATLGSTAIASTAQATLPPQARRSAFPFIAGGIVATVGVVVLWLALSSPGPSGPTASATASRPPPPTAETATTTATPAAAPAPDAARDAGPAASAAPAPPSPPGPAAPPPRPNPPAAPPPQRWAPAAPTPRAKSTKTVDDGF
jgi:serine/threonine-protein kinase